MARFPEVDASWVSTVRQSYERNLERNLAALPTASTPWRLWAALDNNYRELACLLYAAGESLDACRRLLLESARAHLEVVRLRGDEHGAGPGPGWVAPPEYSTGNSRSTYLAICMAVIGGDMGLATSMAPLVWDPPGARYVAPNSLICTTSQQALAYALRHHLLGENDRAKEQVKRLTRVTEDVVGEMLMLRGLVESEPARIKNGLPRVLDWHASVAAEPENYRVAKYFLCMPALGLATLALRQKLLAREDLPADNVYAPRDLIA